MNNKQVELVKWIDEDCDSMMDYIYNNEDYVSPDIHFETETKFRPDGK